MANLIRRIVMGPDYKRAMAFQVGQPVMAGRAQIESIKKVDSGYEIWVCLDEELQKWKFISRSVPLVVEYDVQFE